MNDKFAYSTDPQIWQSFLDGDPEALTYIYQCHYKKLVKYGAKLSADEEFVEDCIQDVFLQLWKNKESIGKTESIRFYLLKALRRRITKDFLKKRFTADIDERGDDYHFIVEYSVEDLLMQEEGAENLKHQLVRALNHLTDRQKEAIYLKFYQELEYAEIASVMNINNQSIRTLVYQGIKLLREKVSLELFLFLPLLAIGIR
jgi:RNA polymerase sigma factor (sigma-70 family)